jgi:hypothetical protein
MAGLDPAIHRGTVLEWMAGSSLIARGVPPGTATTMRKHETAPPRASGNRRLTACHRCRTDLMDRPETALANRMTQSRDQWQQISQSIGPHSNQNHRDRTVTQSLLMADAAVDGYEHVIVASHSVEQLVVVLVSPADI